MIDAFVFPGIPARVVFGSGTLHEVAGEAERLGIERALILSTPEQRPEADRLAAQLGKRSAGVFAGARMHTPTGITEEALALVKKLDIDGTVALGGGSTTGLGKAIAWRTNLPQLVVPTTYAGSEMTSILGETDAGRKTTRRDPKIQPETVVYDIALTLSLPVRLSVTSGINAIAHAVEALYAEDRNPIISLMAAEGIKALATALPVITRIPEDKSARTEALYGAWLCAVSLGTVGMGLHHKLCHVLGGAFDLPHAETHTVVLPHATAYNAVAVPELLRPVADATGAPKPGAGLYDLAKSLGAPVSLNEIGMPYSGLDRAADLAIENTYWNPRPVTREAIRALLDDAWHGRRPEA